MIGKRQHSSPIPENLACEISDATSQVRVSGNRRRGRLYNQPARHCPFFLFLFLSRTLTIHSLYLTLRAPRSFRPFSFPRGSYANSRLPRTVGPELLSPKISRRNCAATKWRPENFVFLESRFRLEISNLARAGTSWIWTRFTLGERETEVPMKGQRHISCARYAIITLQRDSTQTRTCVSRRERASLVYIE